MNPTLKTPKSPNRKWLWIGAIILGGTLLVMVTALLRFKAEIAGATRATAPTSVAAPQAALPIEKSKSVKPE